MVRINAIGSLVGLSVFFFCLAGYLWHQRSPLKEKLSKMDAAPAKASTSLWQKILGLSVQGNVKEKELFTADILLAAFIAVCTYIFFLDMVITLLAGITIFLLFPRLYNRYRIKKLQLEFTKNLPRAIQSITTTMQGGSTMLQGFNNAYLDLPYPINQLFLQVTEDTEANTPMEEAVQRMAITVGTPEAYLLADSIALIKEVGGGKAAINLLESVAENVREGEYLVQKVRANTKHIIFAFAICTAIPFGLAAFLSFAMPEYQQIMAAPQGKFLTVLAVLILIMGWWIVRGIIKKTQELV